jgi:arabinogalactan endo-1,4-beta-galactosidase
MVCSAFGVEEWSRASSAAPRALRVRGADLSSLPALERAGARFSDAGRTEPVEKILAAHGATHARLRLWVNPVPGTSDLPSVLALATRAAAAGLKIQLALHYSDTWADPRNQATPAAWQGQRPDALAATVRSYTSSVVRAFAQQGTPIDVIQIGNEITYGMLWPVGQVYGGAGENWEPFTRLLRAAISGVQDAGGVREIVLHIDPGGDSSKCRYFYDHMAAAGVVFDTIGLSYYPFWNGSLRTLSDNLNDLALRYGKDVLVAETAYPWTLQDGKGTSLLVSQSRQLPDNGSCPANPTGQYAYYERLRSALAAVPNAHGAGFMIWEAAWLPGVPLAESTTNPYVNLGLFSWKGEGLPAIASVRPLSS